MSNFIVMTACAKMPASCWGIYRRVALCEVEAGCYPKMISQRARGMIRILKTWERKRVGKSERCAYEIALREAETLKNAALARAAEKARILHS